MPTVEIALPHHRYPVYIEPGVLDRLGGLVHEHAPHDRCALIADDRVLGMHGRQAVASLEQAGFGVVQHPMPTGEANKTLETVRGAYDALLEHRMERRSPVIALGGGVAGDTAGFVAATYLRGVPFVQCPTTLLAMVDASVGGKVGVNVPQGKNLIGAFYQPTAVVIDPLVLQTLPPRTLRCGLAECVKHALIRDRSLLDWIEANLAKIQAVDPTVMAELVARNVRIKAAVVEEDEKESGVRAHLNFGHTFAHAIEATGGYGVVEHGEAVALGMVAALTAAERMGLCTDTELKPRVTQLLDRIGVPTRANLPATDTLMQAMQLDKKVADNRVRLVLLEAPERVVIRDDVAAEMIEDAWRAIDAA